MKHIIAVNASPRKDWNTAALVRAAAEGARTSGAEAEVIDLYSLGQFTGCISCFGCKTGNNRGRCVCRDALSEVLEKIRSCDGLILGTPNYLGEATAGFRALYERLVFQYITYNTERPNCNEHHIPVLFIMTSNAPDEAYQQGGSFQSLVRKYQGALSSFIGPTEVLVAGDTKQVSDYSRFDWTFFDPAAKSARHDAVFPEKIALAEKLGAKLTEGGYVD
ncbi:MAG: flavodoxin family protein [Oscillospiraceae bacterium]|nr:flavodoxin family protein [Oscillospiraceae bacterium]